MNEPGRTGSGAAARVALLVTTAKDAEITQRLLREAGMAGVVCESLEMLGELIDQGVSALLMTEEGIRPETLNALIDQLQPKLHGRNLPTVILTRGGTQSPIAAALLARVQNVTILERPAPVNSILSAVQSAVRVTARQRERQKLEEERDRLYASERAARIAGERANQLKDEFLATLSHELRTPLNAIVGWVEIMKFELENPAALKEGIDVIERNVRAQGQLIDDLLDVSRIISGKVRLEIKPLQLEEVLQAALETVQPVAAAKGVRLESIIARHAPTISGDFVRLQQVVWNLLSNAIRFTPNGGKVQLLLEQAGSALVVSVTDTGEGIEPDFLPHVFERFRQGNGSPSRRHGGLGLGLSIVKTLVEMHGGHVSAESAGRGQGATFHLFIPIRLAKISEADEFLPATPVRKVAGSPERPDLSGLTILVVDDEPDARVMMHRLLASCRAISIEAATAAEGAKLIAAENPALILSDIGMPGTDGYQFIREARSHGVNIPAVALTAFARSEDRVRSIQAGFQAHLAKPIEPAELLTVVASLCGRMPRVA